MSSVLAFLATLNLLIAGWGLLLGGSVRGVAPLLCFAAACGWWGYWTRSAR